LLQTKSTKTIIGIDSAGIEGRNTHLPGEALSTTGWLWQGVSIPIAINDFSDSNQITVLQFFHFSGYNKALEK
jgi:hypothetical protein